MDLEATESIKKQIDTITKAKWKEGSKLSKKWFSISMFLKNISLDLKKLKENERYVIWVVKMIMNGFKYSNGIKNITTKLMYPTSVQVKE